MPILELRDLEQARRFLLEGLWLQRVRPATAATVRPALEWALEVSSSGAALPPIGFVADLGHLALGLDGGQTGRREPAAAILPAGLARTYEDHVLGKLYADYQFERAGDALRRYQGRDRARGLAFVVQQVQARAGFDGVHLSPGILRGLLELAPAEALARGWDFLSRGGLLPQLAELYQSLIAAARRTADLLGPEDVFELEHGTALAEMGQRVALRQVLQAAARFEAAVPRQRPRPCAGRKEVPTRIFDEDTYPVGGYSAIANRGSIESLLHSQLAYMDDRDRPDLFDIKYLRDELLYYARDENQFRRRRRTFLFALFPELLHTRFKDAGLPWQRVVLWLGLLIAAVRRLTDWLNEDALFFEFCILDGGTAEVLDQEQELLEMVLREQCGGGSVRVMRLPDPAALAEQCRRHARRSLCHCLMVTTAPTDLLRAEDTVVSRLRIAGPRPEVQTGGAAAETLDAVEPLESWYATLERLLHAWV